MSLQVGRVFLTALRGLALPLAILVLGVGLRIGATLFLPPDLPYMGVTKRVKP